MGFGKGAVALLLPGVPASVPHLPSDPAARFGSVEVPGINRAARKTTSPRFSSGPPGGAAQAAVGGGVWCECTAPSGSVTRQCKRAMAAC